jgi:hypothetical protein
MRIRSKRDFSAENISFEIGIFSIKPGIPYPPPQNGHFWTLRKMLPNTQHVRNMSQKCPKWGLAKILLKHEKHAFCD